MSAPPYPPPARGEALGLASGSARRVLFASAHSIVDFSNGAAVASLDALQGLAAEGMECRAFCTSRRDLDDDAPREEIIAGSAAPRRAAALGVRQAPLLSTRRRGIPIAIAQLDSTRRVQQRPEEIRAVLELFRTHLDVFRPDVMLTYGGDPISQGMIAAARRRGVAVVFALHNFAYTSLVPFRDVDHCVAPSDFACRHYRDRLGLECRALPNLVDWDRVRVEECDRRFVTFVNPMPRKGVFPFVRIAHELGRRRPDIPLLVVESRGTRATLAGCGLGRDARVNVHLMANTADPRRFWGLTRIALLPSLWWENQPLAAIEAMINGIPVIGCDRGGVPETLGEAGIVLPLPDRLTEETRIVPTAEEMAPWVEAVIRLWDDREWYDEQSLRSRNEARRWHPERLRPLHAEYFASVGRQAGPPLVAGRAVGMRSAPSADLSIAAARRAIPESARRLLEVRRPEDGSYQLVARRFERDAGSSAWRSVGTQSLDLAAGSPALEGASEFDALLLNGVLESTEDPALCLRRLRPLLASRGVIVASASSLEFFFLTGQLPAGWRADEPPRRLFSPETLPRIFRDAELEAEITGGVAEPHSSAAGSPADQRPAPSGPSAFVMALSHYIVLARTVGTEQPGGSMGTSVNLDAD